MHKGWLSCVFALSGLVISGWPGAASATNTPPVSSPVFRLAGNTLVFPDRPAGTLLSDTYLRADGKGWAFDTTRDTQPVPIRWFRQSDGQFCITRAFRGFPDPGECANVTVSGTRITFRSTDDRVLVAEIKEDDPLGLEARATGRSPQHFTGAEALSMLVGNTLLFTPTGGREPGGALYMMPNGSLQLLDEYKIGSDYVGEIKLSAGRWRTRPDGRLCLAFNVEETCFDLSITDSLVVLRDHHEAKHMGILEQGDVRHLSPQGKRDSNRLLASITGAMLTFTTRNPVERQAALYLGRDGKGEELERKAGRWVRKKRVHWMFRPDLRWLCTFNARPGNTDIRYRTSNCTPLALSEDGIAFKVDGEPPIPITLSKGRPDIVDP
jgi:hypothetical protein